METRYRLIYIEKGDNYEKHEWYDDEFSAVSDFNTMTQAEPDLYTYVKLSRIETDLRTSEKETTILNEWFHDQEFRLLGGRRNFPSQPENVAAIFPLKQPVHPFIIHPFIY